ncbi:hypothetical protein, partial [uncultured Paraglaciecola sp.]|uniref:hypothetical protein n=1 Tax=uncultured Paraglaciecola sp. TaxID=1765024 RepID=UPI0025F062E0
PFFWLIKIYNAKTYHLKNIKQVNIDNSDSIRKPHINDTTLTISTHQCGEFSLEMYVLFIKHHYSLF